MLGSAVKGSVLTVRASIAKYSGVFAPQSPISVVAMEKLRQAVRPRAVSGTCTHALLFFPSTAR